MIGAVNENSMSQHVVILIQAVQNPAGDVQKENFTPPKLKYEFGPPREKVFTAILKNLFHLQRN